MNPPLVMDFLDETSLTQGKHALGIERIECVSQVGHKLFNLNIFRKFTLSVFQKCLTFHSLHGPKGPKGVSLVVHPHQAFGRLLGGSSHLVSG